MDGYLGEIRLFAFPKAPDNWLLCQGQLLPIAQNQALYSLLGVSYGGDGKTTFALPDLRGRTPISIDNGVSLGSSGGTDSVALQASQIPAHIHYLMAMTGAGTMGVPTGLYPAQVTKPSGGSSTIPDAPPFYGPSSNLTPLNPASVNPTGGGAGHENRQPFLAINYCICTVGMYPPRN